MAVERRNGRTVERRGAAIRRANPGQRRPPGSCFGEVVTEFLDGAAVNWRRTLTRNGLATVPVADVDTPECREAPEAMGPTSRRTAEKARLRIPPFGFCEGAGLSRRRKPRAAQRPFPAHPATKAPEVERHPAMPSAEVPAFMGELLALDTTDARALAFTVLTAARTGEPSACAGVKSTSAKRSGRSPGLRMKEGKPHSVPLSTGPRSNYLESPVRRMITFFPSRMYGPRGRSGATR